MNEQPTSANVRLLAGALIGLSLSLGGWALVTTVAVKEDVRSINDSYVSRSDLLEMKIELSDTIRDVTDELKDCLQKIELNRECS